MSLHPGPADARLLGGTMYVWWEADERKVVFYDWDNDEGISLSLSEWERALEWWQEPGRATRP